MAAKRDISVAKKMLKEDDDRAFSIAYNAMLQSARAMMFFDGYTTIGENHHKATVDYADVKLGAKLSEKIELFDRMRRKRHSAVYDKAGAVSHFEAKHAVQNAEDFLQKVLQKLKF